MITIIYLIRNNNEVLLDNVLNKIIFNIKSVILILLIKNSSHFPPLLSLFFNQTTLVEEDCKSRTTNSMIFFIPPAFDPLSSKQAHFSKRRLKRKSGLGESLAFKLDSGYRCVRASPTYDWKKLRTYCHFILSKVFFVLSKVFVRSQKSLGVGPMQRIVKWAFMVRYDYIIVFLKSSLSLSSVFLFFTNVKKCCSVNSFFCS